MFFCFVFLHCHLSILFLKFEGKVQVSGLKERFQIKCSSEVSESKQSDVSIELRGRNAASVSGRLTDFEKVQNPKQSSGTCQHKQLTGQSEGSSSLPTTALSYQPGALNKVAWEPNLSPRASYDLSLSSRLLPCHRGSLGALLHSTRVSE